MEISVSKKKIILNRQEFAIDRFAFKFVSHLEKLKIRYVLVSGYVAIAFGRSRNTEDVDLIAGKITFGKFEKLWGDLGKDFECINANSAEAAYNDYLMNDTAIRFCLEGKFVPNVEFKFSKNRWDDYSLINRVKLVLNGKPIFISPIELQIAYKAWLGSEKDIEDAIYLLEVLREKVNKKLLAKFIVDFNIPESTIKELGVEHEAG